MTRPIAVGHYCEGAGHATRMLAVAERLADRGYEFELAGGGPGEPFVEANGYSERSLPTVDFIDEYQRGSRLKTVTAGTRGFVARVRAYVDWLRSVDPAIFLTDDYSGSLAATIARQEFVYVSHDATDFYDSVPERASARIRNWTPTVTAEAFLFPKVWEGDPAIPGATPVPPIAPSDDSRADDPDVDVLVVPSAFSVDVDELARRLAVRDREITHVGGPDWELQPSLQPYVRAADLVVCSGYSTVMEAAVAGTPCVILPATSEQRGVAAALADTPGFGVAHSIDDVVATMDALSEPRPHENGCEAIADAVVEVLET